MATVVLPINPFRSKVTLMRVSLGDGGSALALFNETAMTSPCWPATQRVATVGAVKEKSAASARLYVVMARKAIKYDRSARVLESATILTVCFKRSRRGKGVGGSVQGQLRV